MNHIILLFVISFLFISCKSTNLSDQEDFFIKNDSINLYVFIGEKISVTAFDPNENSERIEIDTLTGDTVVHKIYSFDYGFNSKYKVVKSVFNELKTDTIEFVTFDHHGRPRFEKYDNVMLYISKSDNGDYYYHQKYQFDPVEKDTDEVWVGLDGESIKELFNVKKNGVLNARGIFK